MVLLNFICEVSGMVGSDGRADATVTGLDNIVNNIKEAPLKSIFIIVLIGFLMGILVSWIVITIKRMYNEEYQKEQDLKNKETYSLLKKYIHQEIQKELQNNEPDEEAIVNFIHEEIKKQLASKDESE